MSTAPAGTVLGIVPVIPTPFTAQQEVDFDALDGLMEFAVRAGVKAACLPAYGSEFYKLSDSERGKVVERAVQAAAGRLLVVAQSNHPSPRLASEIAIRNEDRGANIISFALPRQFALPEEELVRYSEKVCCAVRVPVLIQDFNPGGPTVGAAFARRLMQTVSNFCFLKLEESLMGAKVRAIREATQDVVGVLEGWGGMYLMELIPDGIAGAMPGLAMSDLFVRVWELARGGDIDEAMDIHAAMLPQIIYALQNMELFHHAEKLLLKARGLLDSAAVREPALPLDVAMATHLTALNRKVLRELARLQLT